MMRRGLLLVLILLFVGTYSTKACHMNTLLATSNTTIPTTANATGTVTFCYTIEIGICSTFGVDDLTFYAGTSATTNSCAEMSMGSNFQTTFTAPTLVSGGSFSCTYSSGTGAVTNADGTCDCAAWVSGPDESVTFTGAASGNTVVFTDTYSGALPSDCNSACSNTCGTGIVCNTTGGNATADANCGGNTGCGPFTICIEWTYTNGPEGGASNCITGFDSEGGSCSETTLISGIVMPVTLIDFRADKKRGDIAKLMWSTESEQNSEKFEIQHSSNGMDFVTIGSVKSKANGGFSVTQLNYDFEVNLESTSNLYRLKMMDFDGSTQYSRVISVTKESFEGFEIHGINPNPIADILNIVYESTADQNVKLSVVNMAGVAVYQTSLQVKKSFVTESVDLSMVPSGVYFLRTESGSNVSTMKFIKI